MDFRFLYGYLQDDCKATLHSGAIRVEGLEFNRKIAGFTIAVWGLSTAVLYECMSDTKTRNSSPES